MGYECFGEQNIFPSAPVPGINNDQSLMFSTVLPNLFSCFVIIFVGLVESRETCESEPGTLRLMNILKKPQ